MLERAATFDGDAIFSRNVLISEHTGIARKIRNTLGNLV